MIRTLLAVLGRPGDAALRRLLAGLIAAAAIQGVGYALIVPFLRALLGEDPDSAWPWLAAVGAATAGYAVATWYAQSAAYRTGADLAQVLHHRLGARIVELPLGWFGAGRVGELTRLASQSVLQVMSVPAHLLRPVVTAAVIPLAVVVTLFAVDVRLALALTVALPVLALVLTWSNRAVGRADAARDGVSDEASARLVEFGQAQPVLRAFGRTAQGYDALDAALVAEHDADRALVWRTVPGLVLFSFAVRLVLAVVVVLGTHRVLDGTLDAPTMAAVVVLMIRLIEPLAAAADLGAALRMAHGHLAGIRRVLDTASLPEPVAPVRPVRTDVEFRGVSFGYDDRPVLRDVSFVLPEGSMTALVGPSGAGKTTVARLLARFWDADAGEVRVGGVPVTEIGSEQLMSLVSMVFQDVYLFDGTLADNIRLGRPDATDEEVAQAAAVAGLPSPGGAQTHGELPAGIHTRVGERGVLLSGGQRQRVSIARALLKNAPIVVLDEATAALDPENDAHVQRAVGELARRSTLLVIAHRLPTVLAADQILVLADGRVTQRGRHEELIDAEGTYQRLWQSWESARGWHLLPG
ncbi:ABC transporter ATP-binding protein [Parafrankia sp. FMc6]|uniref:ABC transporter ATP-binding protein n=1 Tax=Parafrankia soli TaxID=2599596 RepID=UPI0034D71E33